MVPKFSLGRATMTPGVEALLTPDEIMAFLRRHQEGDWGVICDEDKALNDHAVETGYRIMSVYETPKGRQVWVITEADRSTTTLLLPEEY